MATITYNKMGPGEGMRPEVTPISVTHAELVAIRDAGNLIPGQFYLITDFVTTTMKTGTRSAGHPFDILVHAVSEKTLSEQAWAVKHDGDTYFNNARLEAWEMKYRLDNVQWSQRACTIIEDENDGYTALSMGTVDIDGETYILWDASEFTEDYGFTRLVSLSMEEGAEMWTYNPATGEKGEDAQTSIAAIIGEITEDGKGTILWMKDEFGNECHYDFKNIQFRRWKVTDTDADRSGLNDLYMGVLGWLANGLSIDDEDDFIWAYTFSSDNSGGEQTDYSLDGTKGVYHNTFGPSDNLPDNVMFGENNHDNSFGKNCRYNSWGNSCYYNSWGTNCKSNSWGNSCSSNSWGNRCSSNSWGNSCYSNSWGNDCSSNSWGNNCQENSWGNNCYSNSWGNDCRFNSWGNTCQSNSWGNNCQKNSWGNDCSYNSWGNSCYSNSWGNTCQSNSWGNEIKSCTLFDSVQHTTISTSKVQYAQVLNGVAGTSSSKMTLSFAASKNYTQVAAKTSAGALKIYVPGDLA